MASVELGPREWEDGEMPNLCMRCGAPATARMEKTFREAPTWASVSVVGPLAHSLLGNLGARELRRVVVVLCERHRRSWRWRTPLVYGVLAGLLWLFLAACGATLLMPGGGFPDPVAGAICIFLLLGGLGWVAMTLALYRTTVCAQQFVGRFVRLSGVGRKFAEACNAKRTREAGAPERAEAEQRYSDHPPPVPVPVSPEEGPPQYEPFEPPEPLLRFTFAADFWDYYRFARAVAGSSWHTVYPYLGLVVLLMAFVGLAEGRFGAMGEGLILFLVPLGLVPQFMGLWSARSWLRADPSLRLPRTFDFDAEGLTWGGEGLKPAKARLTWEDVLKVVETRALFLFTTYKLELYFLPKRALRGAEELAELRRLVRAGVGDRAALRGEGASPRPAGFNRRPGRPCPSCPCPSGRP